MLGALRKEMQQAKEEEQTAAEEKQTAAEEKQAQLGWQVAAAFLLALVLGMFAYGYHRGAWALKPRSLTSPLLQSGDEKLKEDLARAESDMASVKAQELATKKILEEMQQTHAQALAEMAQARAQEAAMKKALHEAHARAEACAAQAAQAQAQEAAAAKALQELQAKAQADLAEASARESAAKKELQDVQAQAEASAAKAKAREAASKKAMHELQEELHRLRSQFGVPPTAITTQPLATPTPTTQSPATPQPTHALHAELPPRVEDFMKGHDPRPRAMSPTMLRSQSPASRMVNMRSPSPAGIQPPGVSKSPSNFGHSPASPLGQPLFMAQSPHQPQLTPVRMNATPPNRFHLRAETNQRPGVMGGFGVGGNGTA